MLDTPEINKALAVLEESTYTDEQLYGYDKFWDIIRTEKTFYHSALLQGLSEGRAEGRAEGMKEGMAKGSLSEKQDTIHRLRANGFDDKTIAIATGMSIDEIRDYLE